MLLSRPVLGHAAALVDRTVKAAFSFPGCPSSHSKEGERGGGTKTQERRSPCWHMGRSRSSRLSIVPARSSTPYLHLGLCLAVPLRPHARPVHARPGERGRERASATLRRRDRAAHAAVLREKASGSRMKSDREAGIAQSGQWRRPCSPNTIRTIRALNPGLDLQHLSPIRHHELPLRAHGRQQLRRIVPLQNRRRSHRSGFRPANDSHAPSRSAASRSAIITRYAKVIVS